MKTKLIFLITLISVTLGFSQSVVKDTANVKKPSNGKLYFQSKDNKVYLFRDKKFENFERTATVVTPPVVDPPIVVDPPVVTPPIEEKVIGFWDMPDRLLITKQISGKIYLLQTNSARTYYVPRGKNLFSDKRTLVTSPPTVLDSEDSDLGGLFPPRNFPEKDFIALGFSKNSNGEYAKGSVIDPIEIMPPVLPSGEKISIPVGLIMWDNWERDYWSDPNPPYDYLINHISRNRYTATVWGGKFNLVPFWGQHVAPERVMIRYNVRWDKNLGRNLYDSLERFVTVRYDKTQADAEREVRYYREAGIDFLCYNYYADNSYLSETRRRFVDMPNKLGMKIAFKVPSKRSDAEIDYITTLMTKDYWLNIDNKPVLYLGDDFEDLPKYRNSLKAKNGKDIYIIYYGFNGYPGDWNDYLKKGVNAVSAYNTSIGAFGTAEQQLQKEIVDRETWMGQFKPTHVKLIPVISLGMENLDMRTDLGTGGKPLGYIEASSQEQIGRKLNLVKGFVDKNPEKVPAIIIYSGTEINEGGESAVPKKLKNGSIDTSTLTTISRHLN